MAVTAFGIEPVGVRRDFPEQVERVGSESPLQRRAFECPVAQTTRLVESAKQETGATEGVVAPAELSASSPDRLTLEEMLTFLESIQHLARLTELGEDPGRGRDGVGKHDDDIRGRDQCERRGPVALEQVQYAAG